MTPSDREPYEFLASRWWWLSEHGRDDPSKRARVLHWLWRILNPINPENRPAEWLTSDAALLAWAKSVSDG